MLWDMGTWGHPCCTGVVAVGQVADEEVGTGTVSGGCHLRPAPATSPIGDVGVERAGEEQWLLGDNGNLGTWGHGDVGIWDKGMWDMGHGDGRIWDMEMWDMGTWGCGTWDMGVWDMEHGDVGHGDGHGDVGHGAWGCGTWGIGMWDTVLVW